MSIRNKILSVILTVLLSSALLITSVWYAMSSKMADTYLENISESVMKDAYHAFEYLLTDTTYMATMISLNESNIIEPMKELKKKDISTNGQWNQEYLKNRRIIQKFINSMNGYKYYIVGITIMTDENCIFSTSHLITNEENIYESICDLNQEELKTDMVLMDPIHVEGGKSTLSSDSVVPAVRAVLDGKRNIIGYTVLYFDYGVIEEMFAANLPTGSHFQVVNENESIIYSNCGTELMDAQQPEKGFIYNTFTMDKLGWHFTMAIPTAYYTRDIRQTALFTSLMIAIIFLLAISIAIIVVSRMTTEITALRDSMHKVSSGDFTVNHPIKSKDEIGQMGYTFNHMVVHIRDLMEQVSEEEKQKRLIEIAFLQAQINPHFISNVLNIVVWMAKIQHADNIVPLINSLNTMLQSVMHQENDFIPFVNELDYVDNYLTIVEYSGSYDFNVVKNVSDDTKNLNILRFIMQPVIENSIYHGLPHDLSKKGCIKISAERKENRLHIIVEDNGNGMTEEQIKDILMKKSRDKKAFNGIGIPNVNERIKLFFGDNYGLHYESKLGEYTRAIFDLPIIEQEEKEEVPCQK